MSLFERFGPHSIRFRMTAWYFIFFLVISLALACFTGYRLHREIHRNARNRLKTEVSSIAEQFKNGRTPAEIARLEIHPLVMEHTRAYFVSPQLEQRRGSHLPLPPRMDPRNGFAVVPGEDLNLRDDRYMLSTFRAGGFSCRLAISLENEDTYFRKYLAQMGLAVPLMLLLCAIGGWMLAGRFLRPIRRIAETTGRITHEGLSRRLPERPHAGDEINLLIRQINTMIANLESAFDRITSFTAFASHEMRTPLAVIRSELDIAATRDREPAEYRETLRSIREESSRLAEIIESLLLLARADANGIEEESPVALGWIAMEAASRYAGDRVRVEGTATVRGNRALLVRLMGNLIDNGLKHGTGEVKVSIGENPAGVWAEVYSEGNPIPPEHRERVFERFYRVSGQPEGGAGLGLTLARDIVRAHGGDLVLLPGDTGNRFRVTFPERKAG